MNASAEELWTACTSHGELITSRGLSKREAAAGILHASCGVWLWRDNQGVQEILAARRSNLVHTWPNKYGLSAGGHVEFGATLTQTVLQETEEELGLVIKPEQLEVLFSYHSYIPDAGEGIIENDMAYIYAAQIEGSEALRFIDGEVSEIGWFTLDQLDRLMAGQMPNTEFVPQGKAVGAMMTYQLGESWARYKTQRL